MAVTCGIKKSVEALMTNFFLRWAYKSLGLLILIFALSSCGGASSQSGDSSMASQKSDSIRVAKEFGLQQSAKKIVRIETYDGYGRIFSQGYGIRVASNTVLTTLKLVKGAYSAEVLTTGSDDSRVIKGYVSYDINSNLVLLRYRDRYSAFFDLKYAEAQPSDSAKTIFIVNDTIYSHKLDVEEKLRADSCEFYKLNKVLKEGMPVFNSSNRLVGISQNNRNINDKSTMIGLSDINKLVSKANDKPESLYKLKGKSNTVYPSYKNIESFTIVTNAGNIKIALYPETKLYRDNFIKLVVDDFYDSLLVHRVIPNFLIQMGAGDTRYAGKDDRVGRQGPGYMLKTEINPKYFVKRGVLAMSKPPSNYNSSNQTDGSQFFIVAGRKWSDKELDEIEKEKGIKIPIGQRNTYKTTGGAAYIHGEYAVFAYVVSGMDVVDKIAASELYNTDRPVNDIRIKDVKINYY